MNIIRHSHWNFISLDPKITNAQEIYNLMHEPLLQQSNFYRYTTESEQNDWPPTKLMDFELDVEKIDRLYQLICEKKFDIIYFLLTVRINDNDINVAPIYASLQGNTRDGGNIFLTGNKQIFNNQYISSFSTHRNFQSHVDYIDNANDLQREICDIYDDLTTKKSFERETIPIDDKEILNLPIDVELIDVVYYFKKDDNKYDLVVRMDYKNIPVYVRVKALLNQVMGGKIFLTKNKQIFQENFSNDINIL